MSLINLENITEGMRIKNYKQLCDLLGIEPLEGNSKKSQIKELERYFTYHKEGQAFIIEEIFNTPKPKQDKRIKYKNYVDLIFLNYLAKVHNNPVISYNDCYRLFDLPEEFTKKQLTNKLIIEYSNNFECKKNSVNYIILAITSKIKALFKKTLLDLKKDNIIDFSEKWRAVTRKGKTKILSDEEASEYEQIQQLVLLEMGYTNPKQINMSVWKRVQYWEKVEEITKNRFGWEKAHKVFDIVVKDKAFIDKYKNLDTSDDITQLHTELKNAIRKDISNKENIKDEYMDEALELLLDNDIVVLEKFIYEEKDIECMYFLLEGLSRKVCKFIYESWDLNVAHSWG